MIHCPICQGLPEPVEGKPLFPYVCRCKRLTLSVTDRSGKIGYWTLKMAPDRMAMLRVKDWFGRQGLTVAWDGEKRDVPQEEIPAYVERILGKKGVAELRRECDVADVIGS